MSFKREYRLQLGDLNDNIKRFVDLGVEVYITELDIGINLWNNGGPKRKVSDFIKT